MRIAHRQYLADNFRHLFTYQTGQGDWIVPRMCIVRSVQFVRERIYPWRDQVCYDWYVTYEDGTTDCMSYGYAEGAPEVGQFNCRADALKGGDFLVWGEQLTHEWNFPIKKGKKRSYRGGGKPSERQQLAEKYAQSWKDEPDTSV